jgi:hypothetical protein
MRYRMRRTALIGSVACGAVFSLAGMSLAATSPFSSPAAIHQALLIKSSPAAHGNDDSDLASELAAYANERSAPAATVSAQAMVDAEQAAAKLPRTGGQWQEFTTKPYQANPAAYADPFWGNEGSGFSLVGGRTTALAATKDAWFAGTADGGVWKSTNQGKSWVPVFDNQSTLSIGSLAVDPATGALWVGTGEANTSQDSYAGTGVYQTSNDGASFQLVGKNNPLMSRTVFQLAFDPAGNAYAATDDGLFRYSVATGSWTEVLGTGSTNPPYNQQVTSVQIVPGSKGMDVIAAMGWRSEDLTTSGFYESTDGGHTFTKVKLSGAINASDIGRATLAYSADGTKLYAIVESPTLLNDEAAGTSGTALMGVYSVTGSAGHPASVAGPWAQIASEATLEKSGSALTAGSTYEVGVQAWYNQVISVDPANANHVYIGLEEVFESTNGGSTWVTASPYWNYGLACGTSCPLTTHPDQHSQMIVDGKIVIGNDGGVYSRPLSDSQQYGGWSDLNASLHTWQFYDARAGMIGNQTAIWGGMQDNGSGIFSTGGGQMNEAAGGDGFDVVVNPKNGNQIAGEYTDGAVYSSTNGGHSFIDPVSPTCYAEGLTLGTPLKNCDAGARFVTPFVQDQQNPNVWVLGGEYVWVSTAGWSSQCIPAYCSWTPVYDTGASNAVTAISSTGSGKTIYAGWVGGGGNPGPGFKSGIATNYGGTWHDVTTSNLPQRYIAGVTVDPSNPAHAYIIYNGYSRRWIPGGGIGHVYETTNGGKTWTNISGNLPDIASDALVIVGHRLALATDSGVYAAAVGQGTHTMWDRLGSGLPNTSVNDITVGPDGYIYAATHGRGVWRIQFGG